MIRLEMSHDGFINDIHPLILAFFPGEEIDVSSGLSIGDTGDFCLHITRDGEVLSEFAIRDTSDKDRILMKNVLKCRLYEDLSSFTGISLPWGTLTGIRPVRLALDHIKNGFSNEETVRWMEDHYLVSREKACLSVDIADKELGIIREVNSLKGFSLYIGIPFCPTTCLYCSFPSNAISRWRNRVPEYLSCVEKEAAEVKELFRGQKLISLYIGGGTPTTLGPEELKRLFFIIRNSFDLSDLKEFTVEAGRPDSITPEKLRIIRENGGDRISVNPQTMNDKTLRLIGRNHSVEDTVRAFFEARDAGFDNINMDIILGLPGEGEKEVSHTLSEIASLGPDDLTIHSLAVKKGSRLKAEMEKYGYDSLNNTDELMKLAGEAARGMGLSPYYLYRQKNMSGNFENTGWARPGREGIYNILMMEEVHSIPAIGAGTVTKYVKDPKDIRRIGEPKDVNQYIERIDELISKKRELYKGQRGD